MRLLRFLLPARRSPAVDVAAIERDLDEALARRKAERLARSKAARAGVSTRWKRAGEQARAMFNQEGSNA